MRKIILVITILSNASALLAQQKMFDEGMEAYYNYEYGRAVNLLNEASRQFRAGGDASMGLKADAFAAISNIYNAQYTDAIETLNSGFGEASADFGDSSLEVSDFFSGFGKYYEILEIYDTALLFHTAALAIKVSKLDPEHKDLADPFINIGIAYDYSGVYDSALVYYEKALANVRKNFGEGHPYTAYLYNDMGVVYGFVNNYERALEMGQGALKSRRIVYGLNSEEAAQSLHNIGVAYEELDQLENAVKYFDESLTLKKRIYNEESPEVASAYSSLGNAHGRNNEYDKAILNNQRSLEIRRKLFGKNHSKTLSTIRNLGNVAYDAAKYSDAIKYYNNYIKTSNGASSPDNNEKADVFLSLGQSEENIGQYPNAMVHFNEAIKLCDGKNETYVGAKIAMARIHDQMSNYSKSIEILNEVKNLYEDDHPKVGFITNNLGYVYLNLSEYNKAKELFEKSLRIREQAFGPESREVAQTLSGFGRLNMDQGNFEDALDYYTKSYDISVEKYAKDHPQVTRALLNISAAQGNLGNYTREIEILDEILAKNSAAYGSDYYGNASVHLNKSLALDRTGNINEARRSAELALKMKQDIYGSESEEAADAMSILAGLLHNSGLSTKSLETYRQALDIFNSIYKEDNLKVADALNNIGVVYLDQNEYKRAREHFELALFQYKNIFGENSRHVAITRNNLALVEFAQDDYPKAIDKFEESIKLGRTLGNNYKPNQSIALQNLGLCYTLNNEPEKAIESYRESLLIKQNLYGGKHYEVADLMINIGNYYSKNENYDSAEFHFLKARDIYVEAFNGSGVRLARAYNNISDVNLRKGDIESALKFAEEAIELNRNNEGETIDPVQEFVSQVGISDIYLTYYNSTQDKKYLDKGLKIAHMADELLASSEQNIFSEQDKINFSIYKTLLTNIAVKNASLLYGLSGDEKFVDEALYFAERSKSNILLSAIRASNVKNFKSVDQYLVDEERDLKLAIQKVNQEIYQIGDVNSEANAQKVEGLKRKLFELNRSYALNQTTQKEKFQKHFNLTHDESVVSLDDLRNSLTPSPNVALVEYAISDSTLQIVVIHQSKSAILSISLNEPFEKKLDAFRKAIMFKADNVLHLISNEIYDKIFEPVEKYFASENLNIDELVIVPEGPLNYLPFEALFRTVNDEDKYLIENYSVSYAYSFSLLDFIQTRQRVETNNSCLAFAPVFAEESESSQLTSASKELFEVAARDMTDKTRAFTLDGQYVAPLPGTEKEVRKIDEIVKAIGMSSRYFTYGDADESVLKSGILKDYKFIHFATHGFINEVDPAYSGILMSQNPESQEDCILYASEIYNLEIHADLVTLSACETGLGRMAFGEGIVGLTRSFLYAGASNLLVSQWKVNDESTSRLMIDFYSKILNGQDKNDALREAKLALIKTPDFKNPYYWAPFVLIGK